MHLRIPNKFFWYSDAIKKANNSKAEEMFTNLNNEILNAGHPKSELLGALNVSVLEASIDYFTK